MTLDVALADRPYAFAKLDIEGAEHLALLGSVERLAQQNPPVWQIELFGSMLQSLGSSYEAVVEMLLDRGYTLATYDADRNVLVKTYVESGAKNILAIAEEHWDWVGERLAESAYEPGHVRLVG